MDKMKVLVLTAENLCAVDFYRTVGPFSRMDDVDITFSSAINWSILLPFDVVVISRPHTEQLFSIVRYLKVCKKCIWIDTDDSHFSVPETNPFHKKLTSPEAIYFYLESLKLADVITCATEGVKEEILSYIPEAKIVVIPNAVDETLFGLTPKYHQREKVVLWRGSSTHHADLDAYKESIFQLITDYPEYKWAFMGSPSSWVNEIPEDRRSIYPYMDIMHYFDTLMELKPQIMIVPLEDNKFNRCKSNISWQEGTLAGATILASDLPEFRKPGILRFDNNSLLREWFRFLVRDEFDSTHQLYNDAICNLPKLSDANKLRKEVLDNLIQLNPKF